MGSRLATLLRNEELNDIERLSGFTKPQILRLYHRFNQLDKEQKGFLTREDLQRIPELAVNPIGTELIRAFFASAVDVTDKLTLPSAMDESDGINFYQFVCTLAIFRLSSKKHALAEGSPLNSREEKLKFAFNMYSPGQDGCIREEGVLQVLHQLVGDHITSDQLTQIAQKTISEASKNNDGTISFAEFQEALEKIDVEEKMSIRFLS